MCWAGHAACKGEEINGYYVLVGKRRLVRSRRIWEDSTEKDHKQMGQDDVDWD
jgi:hypothetical protein